MIHSESWLGLLCCPRCRGDLCIDSVTETAPDGHLMQALLRCQGCAATYPVIRGIPRFLVGMQDQDAAFTIESFGYEWLRGNSTVIRSRMSAADLFLDFIQPVIPGDFAGKVVLDAGCGQARFTDLARQFGAQAVVGVDLSDAVEAAFQNTRSSPNILIIQADLLNLPLRSRFDYIFSVGVLHHTADPRRAFGALAARIKPGGSFSAWVYGRENNGWIIHVLNPIRKRLTSRLPHSVLWFLSYLITVPLYILITLVYRPVERLKPISFLRRVLPYFDYLCWLGRYCGFREQMLVVFDHLSPVIAQYISRDEFASWFQENGLSDVVISSRANNSWRGFGVRPPGDSLPI